MKLLPAIVLLMAFTQPAMDSTPLASSAAELESVDAYQDFLSEMRGWSTWAYKFGISKTHGVVADEPLWTAAARISPLATTSLAARQHHAGRPLAPLVVNGFSGVTCSGFVPTAEGAMQLVAGSVPDMSTQTLPLAPGELYLTEISTEYQSGIPSRMQVSVYLYSPPRLYEKAALLDVGFAPTPKRWAKIAEMPLLAPVMEITSVSGWESRPPFEQVQ